MKLTIEAPKDQIESMLNHSVPTSKIHVLRMLRAYEHNLEDMKNNYEAKIKNNIRPDYTHDHNFVTSQLDLIRQDINKVKYNLV